MASVAIAIVHYHAEALLARCLMSIRASTLTDFAVVVVDNGSTTRLKWMEGFDPRVRLLHAPANVGFSAGVNLCLAELPDSAPYLLLLNPDVVVEPDTLAKTAAILSADASLGAVTCKVERPDGTLDPACRRSDPTLMSSLCRHLGLQALFPRSRFFGRYNLTHLDHGQPHDVDSGTAAFLLLKREALAAAGGGMDERFFLYGEDLDLCRRIRGAGYRILYWPNVRAIHVKGSGRPRGPRASFEFHRAMWTYYRKWGTHRRNVLVLAPLLVAIVALGAIELIKNAPTTARNRRKTLQLVFREDTGGREVFRTVPMRSQNEFRLKNLATRVLDLAGATFLALACMPITLVTAVLVKVASGSPVLFSHERLGKNGVPFRLYKFRTMRPDAESFLRSHRDLYARYVANDFKLADEQDPRVTNVGRFLRRFGLDELPQLWNVLRGDMSLVGPRPIVPPEIDRYGEHAALLLSVKPGLTGRWQVERRSVRYPDRARLDLEYVLGRSLRVDLGILLRTVPALLRRQMGD